MVDMENARREVLEWVAQAAKLPPEEVPLDKPLAEIGVDSLDAVHMIATIESIIQTELPEDVVQRVRCMNDIFDMMQERVAAA